MPPLKNLARKGLMQLIIFQPIAIIYVLMVFTVTTNVQAPDNATPSVDTVLEWISFPW